MPFPCHATNMPFTAGSWQGRSMVMAWYVRLETAGSRHGDGMVRLETAGSWHARSMLTKCYIVGDLPAISFMLLHAELQEGLLSEAYQSQMPVTSVKESNACRGRGETYYFGARTGVLV